MVKTDKVDSATLANLLRANLLPLYDVPKKEIRLNREFLGYRTSLVKNKIYTVLAENNISHSYADLFGKQGMTLLHSLAVPMNCKIALVSPFSLNNYN
jgi:hypothetical protein